MPKDKLRSNSEREKLNIIAISKLKNKVVIGHFALFHPLYDD